jgi:hypothetical protein
MDDEFLWSMDEMLEVELTEPDDFLRIKETLTRIGVASKKEKTLFQSCLILHKQSKYYIIHFKEIFRLDKKWSDISYNDMERRNTIALLLEQWGLCNIIWKKDQYKQKTHLSNIKIISHAEKRDWNLVTKAALGQDKKY